MASGDYVTEGGLDGALASVAAATNAAQARLVAIDGGVAATGTRSGDTFLAGDGTWKVPPAGTPSDPTAVKLAGDQTLTGVKTFQDAPVLPTAALPIAATAGLQSALDSAKSRLAALEASPHPVRVTYTSGVWPARPSGTMPVDWLDPTGTAPTPPMVLGDTLIRAEAPPATTTQLLSTAQRDLTIDWYASAGNPTVDLAAGRITVTTSADKAGIANVDCQPARALTLTVSPVAGTGAYTLDIDFYSASGGYITSKWGDGPTLHVPAADVPTDARRVAIVIQGRDGAVTIDTVSLTQDI